MARPSPPTMFISPTPVERSSSGLTSLSASSVSSRTGRSADRATVITGCESLLNLLTTGGSTSRGCVDITIEIEGGENDRCALPGDRAQFLNAFDGVDGFLDLLRDLAFDFF